MHFERRYKICICSVILGELEYFRSYKGFGIIFPEIFYANWRIPLSITFFNPKMLGYLFPTPIALPGE